MLRPALLSVLLAAASTCFADMPNIVIVITDDQGYGDLSCHGNPVLKTPNLDALHAESTRLTDYHVSPTCAPTRSALMTGRFSNRTGVWHTINGRSILRKDEVTLARVLSDNGYATGMFGKWHLGDNYPSRPEDTGFTEVYRHGGGGVGQTPDYWDNAYFDGSYFHNSKPVKAEGFCTDVFFAEATRFIGEQVTAEKPFFAYIATNAPHGPMHSPPEWSAPYKDQSEGVANFLGMIANIDHNVGQLRSFLADQGVADNTLFIFTTDNGTSSGGKIFNAGMRAQKGSEYDGGHRVPFFLHWPAKGWNEPRDINRLAAHVDILPTVVDLLNVAPPVGRALDGTSLLPLLEGKAEGWPDRTLVTDSQRIHMPEKWRKSAVMTDRWRLVNGKELYDIESDVGQKANRAKDYPEVVEQLRSSYEQWWASMEASFKDDCEIIVGNDAENPATLTAHDWMLSDSEGNSPWNHKLIRAASGASQGAWAIDVEKPGSYRVELRRWPKEADLPISAELAPGEDVPGQPAFRTQAGKAFPAVKATLKVGDEAQEAALEGGITRLQGNFIAADGAELGAYYAIVERL
jgi:arylsulfatase B